MTLVFRGRTRDYEWDDGQWPQAVNYILSRSGMVVTPTRRYRMRRVRAEHAVVEGANWIGMTFDGNRIDLPTHQISSLHAQIPTHYKAHKYFNGRSLEVGGARFVRIAAGSAEAIKRGWTDLADAMAKMESHDDQTLHEE